jgi:hypothetical protein
MLSANRAAAEQALELYSDCVRWLLLVGGGYECQVRAPRVPWLPPAPAASAAVNGVALEARAFCSV